MPYDFWIEKGLYGKPVLITLADDGTFLFNDYDVRADASLNALGMRPSFPLQTLFKWEKDPIAILCGAEPTTIPLRDNALAAWAWAKLAVNMTGLNIQDKTSDPHVTQVQHLLHGALNTAFDVVIYDPPPYEALAKVRKDVANMHAKVDSFHRGRMISRVRIQAITVVSDLLEGVFLSELQKTRGIDFSGEQAQNKFCGIADDVEKIIRNKREDEYEMSIETPEEWAPYDPGDPPTAELVEAAIEVLGKVQEAEEDLR